MFIRELTTKMTFWAGVLLMFGAYMVTAEEFPLDMANKAVDDMYDGCADQMLQNVKNKILDEEKKTNTNFSHAWNDAEENCKLKKKGKNKKTIGSEREEALAVYAYTNARINIYDEFNRAVREQGPQYKTAFKYRSLHYFLTRAIQKLAAKNTGENCQTAYRRTRNSFEQDVLNKNIRFGQFTSSSKKSLEESKGKQMEEDFGEKSCFVIKTCFGADISIYSKVESEAEILIPPYEEFKVTKIENRTEVTELPCEVVYTVNSTEIPVSNYNCAFVNSSPCHG